MKALVKFPLVVAMLIATSVCSHGGEPIQAPKITDARLGSMRYGGESVVYWVDRMKQGDQKRGSQLIADLNNLRTRMLRMKAVDAEQVKLLNRYFTQIEQAIQRKSSAEKETVHQSLGMSGRDPKNQAAKPHTASNSKSNSSSQSRPAATSSTKMSRSEVAQFVNEVQEKYSNGGSVALPKIRYLLQDGELEKQEVDEVIAAMTRYKSEVDKDLPTLKRVVAETGMGEYWLRWISGEQMKTYQQEVRILQSSLDNKITRAANDVANRIQLDTKKHNFQFRGDAATKALERFDAAIRMIEQATRLETPLGLDGHWSGKKSKMVADTAKFRRMVDEVDRGASTKLPTAIVNPELRKIAERVLKKEKYGVQKWERLIVNSKLMPRERIEHAAFNGKLETIVRRWQEFQVTTVETDEKGKHYLYFNMIAKFSQAPQTTPIGEWILTKRFKGNAIAKENLK